VFVLGINTGFAIAAALHGEWLVVAVQVVAAGLVSICLAADRYEKRVAASKGGMNSWPWDERADGIKCKTYSRPSYIADQRGDPTPPAER
jgi:hypothetical protein